MSPIAQFRIGPFPLLGPIFQILMEPLSSTPTQNFSLSIKYNSPNLPWTKSMNSVGRIGS